MGLAYIRDFLHKNPQLLQVKLRRYAFNVLLEKKKARCPEDLYGNISKINIWRCDLIRGNEKGLITDGSFYVSIVMLTTLKSRNN